ncbi:MAG: helix-turn-helix domain-containing protein [Turicibacter sp.]|nr:helix-turn-helix domain-containing protein [Turicibacter sp.]
MNERVYAIRKKRDLTQSEFAEKLRVTATTISRIEKGERGLTEQMLLTICREYGVNEIWLRTGEGEMFLDSQVELLNYATKKYDLDEFEIKFAKQYLTLTSEQKMTIKEFIMNVANKPNLSLSPQSIEVPASDWQEMKAEIAALKAALSTQPPPADDDTPTLAEIEAEATVLAKEYKKQRLKENEMSSRYSAGQYGAEKRSG